MDDDDDMSVPSSDDDRVRQRHSHAPTAIAHGTDEIDRYLHDMHRFRRKVESNTREVKDARGTVDDIQKQRLQLDKLNAHLMSDVHKHGPVDSADEIDVDDSILAHGGGRSRDHSHERGYSTVLACNDPGHSDINMQLNESQRRSQLLEERLERVQEQLDSLNRANVSLLHDFERVTHESDAKSRQFGQQRDEWKRQQQLMGRLSREHEQLVALWSQSQQLRHNMQDVRAECNRQLAAMKTQLHSAAAQIQTGMHTQDLLTVRNAVGYNPQVIAAIDRLIADVDQTNADTRRARLIEILETVMETQRELAEREGGTGRTTDTDASSIAATPRDSEELAMAKARISQLEASLGTSEQQVADHALTLSRLYQLATESSGEGTNGRSRSMSPTVTSQMANTIRAILLNLQHESKELKSVADGCKERVAELESKLQAAEEERKRAVDELSALKSRMQLLTRQRDEASSKARADGEQLRLRSERQADALRKETDDVRKKYEDATARVEALQKALDANQYNKADLHSKLGRAEEAAEREATRVKALEARLLTLSGDKDKLGTELSEQRARANGAEGELKNAQVDHETLLKKYEAVSKQLKELQAHSDGDHDQLAALRREMLDVQARRDILETSVNKLTDEKTALQSKLNRKTEDFCQRDGELEELLKKLDDAKTALGEKADRVLELDAMVARHDAVRQDYERQVDDLKHQLTETVGQNQTAGDKLWETIQRLENERGEAEAAVERSRQQLSEAEALEQQLRQRLHERQTAEERLRQEHTSLQHKLTQITSKLMADTSAFGGSGLAMDESDAAGPDGLNMGGVENVFAQLQIKIEKLTEEKSSLGASLTKNRQQLSELNERVQSLQLQKDTAETRLTDTEHAKRAVESRLYSLQKLLTTQEQEMKSKNDEMKKIKHELRSSERHLREKEIALKSAQDELKSVHAQLKSSFDEKRQLQSRMEEAENGKIGLQARVKYAEGDLANVKQQLSSAKRDLQTASSQVATQQSQLTEKQSLLDENTQSMDSMRQDIDRLNGELLLLQSQLDDARKSDVGSVQQKYAMERLQTELDEANKERRRLDGEAERARADYAELQATRKRLDFDVTQLEAKLAAANDANALLRRNINDLENDLTSRQASESQLLERVAALDNDNQTLSSQLTELRNQLRQADTNRHAMLAEKDKFNREIARLNDYVKTLEAQSARLDKVLTETARDRQALDKALSTMERENMELHTAMTHLRSQIAELEHGQARQLMELSKRDCDRTDSALDKAIADKKRLEKLLRQRQQMNTSREESLSSQLRQLREQLDREKQMRRDLLNNMSSTDRDISRLHDGVYRSFNAYRTDPLLHGGGSRNATFAGLASSPHKRSSSPYNPDRSFLSRGGLGIPQASSSPLPPDITVDQEPVVTKLNYSQSLSQPPVSDITPQPQFDGDASNDGQDEPDRTEDTQSEWEQQPAANEDTAPPPEKYEWED